MQQKICLFGSPFTSLVLSPVLCSAPFILQCTDMPVFQFHCKLFHGKKLTCNAISTQQLSLLEPFIAMQGQNNWAAFPVIRTALARPLAQLPSGLLL